MNQRLFVWGVFTLILAGCQHQQARLQSPEEGDRDKDSALKTIGDISEFANAEPIPVSGVSLVTELDGTGGSPPPGGFRDTLEKELQRKGVNNIKELLASPNASLVLVSGVLPAGARKGDPIDLEITVPPGSKTTSLRGGYLQECRLFNYDSKKHLRPDFAGPDGWVKGHPVAKASGRLVAGFGDGDEAARQKQARIWGGGRSLIDRAFYIVLKSKQNQGPVAQRVAERINETFHGPQRHLVADMAKATNADKVPFVMVSVPQQYKLNLPRFLRVVRFIPLREAPSLNSPYVQKCAEGLLDPAHTVSAALRLEALGADSIDLLKRGLKDDHPLVRFCSAEALAYLGCPACGEELAAQIAAQPLVRAYGLTALASLDEAICHVKLAELLASDDRETRYGAFRALRTLDESDQAVQGELLNESFWLHRVASGSTGMVHLSCSRRPEVVLFGDEPQLTPPFSFLAGEFTITAGQDDDRCTISRFCVGHEPQRRQCPLQLTAVIHTLADLGGSYAEVVDLLRQAGTCRTLTCSVAVDALPQAVAVQELAERGQKRDPEFLKAQEEFVRARDEFGTVPTLFETTGSRRFRQNAEKDDADRLTERKKKDGKPTAQRTSGRDQ